MTNSLTAIQKCARVFRVLVRIGLILSIVGAVFGLAALMLWIHWNNAPATGIPQLDQVMQLIDRGSYYHTLSTLIADVVAPPGRRDHRAAPGEPVPPGHPLHRL